MVMSTSILKQPGTLSSSYWTRFDPEQRRCVQFRIMPLSLATCGICIDQTAIPQQNENSFKRIASTSSDPSVYPTKLKYSHQSCHNQKNMFPNKMLRLMSSFPAPNFLGLARQHHCRCASFFYTACWDSSHVSW